MNLQNTLYIVAVAAFAIASYYAIEMHVIQTNSDIQTKENGIYISLQKPKEIVGEDKKSEQLPPKKDSVYEPVEARDEEVSTSATNKLIQVFEYQDGEYTVDTNYTLPNGKVHDMQVSFTFLEDLVSSVVILFDGKSVAASTPTQKRFVGAMNPLVVGAPIDSLSLSRTGAASLTTNGFNDALEKAKELARS